MSSKIDFRELRARLDFGDVLRHYGITLKLVGDQHHGFCPLPLHGGKKNSPSFSANLKRGIWQCFGCGRKGNVLDFAVLMEKGDPKNGEDVHRVAVDLERRFSNDPATKRELEQPPRDSDTESVVINAPLDFELKGLDAKHSYFELRRFDQTTIEWFELGFCSRGLLKDRVAIPIHDFAGRLIGYAGRLVADSRLSEENPKYKFPGRRRRNGVIHEFRKSLLVYNAHRIGAQSEVPVSDLVVVEGFTGVWWLQQAGIGETVALMGASCSAQQADILVSLLSENGRLWILSDGDAAGERCAHEVFERVAPRRCVRWIRLKEGEQPTDHSADAINDLLAFAKGGCV